MKTKLPKEVNSFFVRDSRISWIMLNMKMVLIFDLFCIDVLKCHHFKLRLVDFESYFHSIYFLLRGLTTGAILGCWHLNSQRGMFKIFYDRTKVRKDFNEKESFTVGLDLIFTFFCKHDIPLFQFIFFNFR